MGGAWYRVPVHGLPARGYVRIRTPWPGSMGDWHAAKGGWLGIDGCHEDRAVFRVQWRDSGGQNDSKPNCRGTCRLSPLGYVVLTHTHTHTHTCSANRRVCERRLRRATAFEATGGRRSFGCRAPSTRWAAEQGRCCGGNAEGRHFDKGVQRVYVCVYVCVCVCACACVRVRVRVRVRVCMV